MPMVGKALGDLIVTAIQAVPPPSPIDGGTAFLEAYWEAVATTIVTYIQTNAQVAVASVTLVTPGVGASGPGVGTIL